MKKELTVIEYAEKEGITKAAVYMRIAVGTVESKRTGETGRGQLVILIDSHKPNV